MTIGVGEIGFVGPTQLTTLIGPNGEEIDVRIGLGLGVEGWRSPPSPPPPPAPIADWQFEGNLNDSSGNGHTLVVVAGAAGYVVSPDGHALGGPGVTCLAQSSFTFGNLSSTPKTFVVLASCIGVDATSPFSVRFNDGQFLNQAISVITYDNGAVQALTWSSDAGSLLSDYNTGLPLGEYLTHVLVLNGDGSWAIYLNGSQIASGGTGLINVVGSRVDVSVGEDGEGAIERVRIFDVALTARQVASLSI